MATPLPTSAVLPLSVDLRPDVQLRKLAGSTFRKKDPLYHLATSHFIMLSVCHNAAQQMMEQLIIHQLALGLWLTSRAFSGYVRVQNTEGEKEKVTSCSKQCLDSERKRTNLMTIVVVVVVAVVAVAVCG